jgi:hypothetical protein
MYLWKVINSEKYTGSYGQDIKCKQMLIILNLLKCLDIKKLYFWVQIGRQILTCIPDPKKSNMKLKKKKNRLAISVVTFFLGFL